MSLGRRVKIQKQLPTRKPSILRWAGLTKSSTLGLLLLLGLGLSTGISVVYTTHESRFAFNQLQELKDQAIQLDVEWGQLLIEQSTFGVEGKIEQKAIDELHMQVPELTSIVMVSSE